MKFGVLILLFLILSAACAGQEICVLESNNIPALRNLRAGMLPEEAHNALGRELKIKIKKNGERTFFQNFVERKAPPALSGVRALYLRFFDRRLYQIEIFYENRNDWQTLTDFTASLASSANFPASIWQIEKGRAEIKCGELSLVADNVLNPRIELTNEIVRARIETIRQKDKN